MDDVTEAVAAVEDERRAGSEPLMPEAERERPQPRRRS